MRKVLDLIKSFFRQADIFLLSACVIANLYGIVLIYSATRYRAAFHSLAIKQGAAMALGIVVFVVCNYIDIEILLEKWKWLLVFNLGFIGLLLPFGTGYNGNKNWLEFSWLPFNIQPSEIVKIFFVLLLAKQLVYLQSDGRNLSSVKSVSMLVGHLLLMCGEIFLISGDAGSALVYVLIFLVMVWIAGLKKRWFLIGGALIAAAGYVGWNMLPADNYWKMRILVCFDHELAPLDEGWHQARSLLAIRSGGLTGLGYLRGNLTQSLRSDSLPERYTDFIFSVCAEELGMVGCIVILLLLAVIILRCVYVGLTARSSLSALAVMGYAGMLAFQTALNVGMCLYVMPVIGITLPFFSYGGSSLMTLYAAMGFVSGVKMRGLPSWLRDRTDLVWRPK